MTWKPTHMLHGTPVCRMDSAHGPVFSVENDIDRYAVPEKYWKEHSRPIIEVGTATLPWVSVDDVPHPIGPVDRAWLFQFYDGDIRSASTSRGYTSAQSGIVRWCWAS